MQDNIASDSETERLKVHWLGPQGAPSLSHWPRGRYSKLAGPQAHESPPPPRRTTRGHRLQSPGTKGDAELKSSVTPAAPHVLSCLASTTSPTANPHPRHPGTSRPALPWGLATAPCKCMCLGGAHQQVDASLRGGHTSRTSPQPGLGARRQKVELTASQVLLPGSL